MGQKLHHRIETWKKLLLDLGKRNRLINFKEGKRSCVKLTTPYEKLFEQIVVRENDLKFPYSKKVVVNDEGEEVYETIIPGDIETNLTISELQKTLKALRYRANTSIEEQGINILYLAFGMLKWRESDDSTEVYSAPIVLVPVRLTIASLVSPYVLSLHEDEIVINPTLQYKLENDFGIRFPEIDSLQDSIKDYLDGCNKAIENKGWSIDRSAYLTNLSFLKINMYKDLERNEERLENNNVISALVGEADPLSVPEDLNHYDHDKNERPIDVFQVVDADSSQQDAILLSKKGVSFVLQGPPGTGKSQTITNIISEALADGKKVLFVSEKMAALQVVYNRLESVGLSDFCFTLHSHKANKKEILRDLEKSIHIDRIKVREDAYAQYDTLEKKRTELNKYQQELHMPCSALNTTIFEINGKLAKLSAVPDVVFSIPDVEKISSKVLNGQVYLLNELSKTIGKRSEDYDKNVWNGATVNFLSNELRHDIDSNVSELVSNIPSLNKSVTTCCSELGLPVQHTFNDVRRLIVILQLAKESPLLPERWLSDNHQTLNSRKAALQQLISQINDEYNELSNKYVPEYFNVNAVQQQKQLLGDLNKVSAKLRFSDNNELASRLSDTRQQLAVVSAQLTHLFTQAESLSETIGLARPNTIKSLRLFVGKLYWLIQNLEIIPTQNWFNKKEFTRIRQSLSMLQDTHDKLAFSTQEILKEYDKEILDMDSYAILQRFRGEYNTWFRFLKSQYRKDLQLIQGYSKRDKKIGYNEAVQTLELLKIHSEKKESVDTVCEQCKEDLGSYYQGIKTDWGKLGSILEEFEKFLDLNSSTSSLLISLMTEGNLPLETLKQFTKLYIEEFNEEVINTLPQLLVARANEDCGYADLLTTIQKAIDQSASFAENYDKLRLLRKGSAPFDSLMAELKVLEAYQKNVELFESKEKEHLKLFGSYYQGMQTDWEKLDEALNYAQQFKDCIKSNALPTSFAHRICSDSESVSLCRKMYDEIAGLKNCIDKPLSWFESLFEDGTKLKEMYLLDLADYLTKCKNNKHLLEEWVDYRANMKKCEEAGLSIYVMQINDQVINGGYIVDAYLKRFYRLWLDKMLEQFTSVRDFRRRIQEQNIDEFCDLDVGQFKITRARVKERLISRIPDFDSVTTSRDEIGILKRELSKQRRIMPLRKLFMAIPNLLSTIRPCFMMSPLSVSVFLEAQSYTFDMVIFDEASQVHTEDAIGAIMRGKQAIIVGDTKQLPPTNFFTASLNDDDFDVDSDDEIQDTSSNAYESILDEAVTVLPERSLRWHYRSRDEHLIAFSNIKIYNGALITFPSALDKAPDLGVEYVHVTNGVYDRSGKRDNMIEAKKVAELVFAHFRKHPDRSLGVVTFSEAQQAAVDAAIRQLRLKNTSMEHFFDEEKEEPFFVKNLENVQGDERDTIFFSIGYAKDSNGIMYMNFGPLSREGGYRRLNVAITRAKYNVKLIGSITATDIDLDKTSSEGVKLLRSYIDYAQRGIVALESETSYSGTETFDSPFEEAVYDFLCSKGYEVVTQVGCSGFRIDMAIKHPSQSGKFAIGIECDGAMYHSSRMARERDRLRQTVLEDMGWNIYRIWSTDWIKNQHYEEERLIQAIEAALSEITFDEPIKKVRSSNTDNIEVEEKIVADKTIDEGYGFDTYKEIPWHELWGDSSTETILNVIKAYQPIHFEALCRILAPLWGNKKATNVIRDNVSAYLTRYLKGQVKRQNDFVTLSDFTDIKVRVPASPDDVRPIELICADELALAMKTIAEHSFGITPENLFTETARVYGFKRTGGKISTTLRCVFEQMLHDHVVTEIDGKVSVNY